MLQLPHDPRRHWHPLQLPMSSNKATYRITCRWPYAHIAQMHHFAFNNPSWAENLREKVREYAQLVAETEKRLIIIMRQVTPMQLHEALTDWESEDLSGFTVVRRP